MLGGNSKFNTPKTTNNSTLQGGINVEKRSQYFTPDIIMYACAVHTKSPYTIMTSRSCMGSHKIIIQPCYYQVMCCMHLYFTCYSHETVWYVNLLHPLCQQAAQLCQALSQAEIPMKLILHLFHYQHCGGFQPLG